jgi:DNA topoisomerase VI subunit B
LQTTDPEPIKQNIANLQHTLNSDPPQVQEINRKRIEILGKRLEKYEKVRDNQKVVQAQCSAIEDVLQLINDQSVTMRDPQQVSDQLDNLVRDVEQTEETVRQVEAVFDMAVPGVEETLSPLPTDSSVSSPGSVPNSRIRN